MLNSYYPQGSNITGSDQVHRTLTFLASNPTAASVFYQNISKHLPFHRVCKLAVMLIKYISSSIHSVEGDDSASEKRRRVKRTRTSKNNAKSPESRICSALPNTSVMAAVAETITHLLVPVSVTILFLSRNQYF